MKSSDGLDPNSATDPKSATVFSHIRRLQLILLAAVSIIIYGVFHGQFYESNMSSLRPVRRLEEEPIPEPKIFKRDEELIDATTDKVDDLPKPANKPFSKLAIMILYGNDTWPAWFNAFVTTTQFSPDVDWFFIFPEENLPPMIKLPSTIKIIRLPVNQIAKRILSLGEDERSPIYARHLKGMEHLIITQPALLQDFKPCLGHLFQDYISGYSHWAYTDIDVLFGRFPKLLSPDVIDLYDVVTVSFGDPFVYLRGELTIFRNREDINNLWRSCSQYTHIGERLLFYMGNDWMKWEPQSPEGCFSISLFRENRLNLLISNSEYSDFHDGNVDMKESLFLGEGLVKCYSHPVDLSPGSAVDRVKAFIAKDKFQKPAKNVLKDKNLFTSTSVSSRCLSRPSFMAKYDTCMEHIPPRSDIVRVDEKLYYTLDKRREIFQGDCWEGSLMHFVSWKDKMYSHTCPNFPKDANMMLVTNEGFIPYRAPIIADLSYGSQIFDKVVFTMGRVTSDPNTLVTTADDVATSYCLAFSTDLAQCCCYLRKNQFNIRRSSIQAASDASNDITLITIGLDTDFADEKFHNNLKAWGGPKIVLLGRYTDSSASNDMIGNALGYIPMLTIVEVDLRCLNPTKLMPSASMPKSISLKLPHLHDNLLYNIGLDLLTTDLVCVLPPEFHLFAFDGQKTQLERLISDQLKQAGSQPTAIVIPTYHIDSKNQNDPTKLSPFPSDKIWYGKQQPNGLKYPYADSSGGQLKQVDNLSHMDLSYELTVTLGIAFSVSMNNHGTGFVRFPEELSGLGCYGGANVRVLQGSGYLLQWSQKVYALHNRYHSSDSGDKSSEAPRYQAVHYGCISSTAYNSTKLMLRRFNRYYSRATTMRQTSGVSAIYSRKSYFTVQEKFQLEVLGISAK